MPAPWNPVDHVNPVRSFYAVCVCPRLCGEPRFFDSASHAVLGLPFID